MEVRVKGWKILEASIRLLMNNIGAAFRVSVVPGLMILALSIALIAGVYALTGGTPEPVAEPGVVPVALVVFVIYAALFASVAVSWHRHVLLAEPVGWLPALRRRRIGAYALRVILLVVLLLAIGFLVMTPIFLITGASDGAGVLTVILGLVALLFLNIAAWRFSTALPGAALDRGEGFGAAWTATQGEWPAMLILVVGFGLISFLCGLIGGLLAIVPVLGMIANLAINWFLGMLGLSILTTLYGHYIEKRPLV
ncbi:hypothetical protein GCM10010991_23180 [Gemmobacter aquaticus]|uniref:Glycerophosphoryl diester phosphodiesterase membrane domain-containing protein n=2 Tax=Gemmobacter aquaticus TaxID=490185 RepID=A0A917YJZ5_9RHOB|nr:hypothetical protein GCM10010991_23180 [Gemmobacter aquaticus]